MKSSNKEIKAKILITGEELEELHRQSYQFSESFSLDTRIDNYKGKRPISFSGWDFDSLFPILEIILEDANEYPDKKHPRYIALHSLYLRLKSVYADTFSNSKGA